MKARYKKLMTLVLAVCIVFALNACSKTPETGECTGTLTDAYENSIVVSTDEGAQEFRTSEETVYNLGEMKHLSVDDVVVVRYHKKGSKMYADRVTLREHVEKQQIFSGSVTEVTDETVTVTGKSMTIAFVRNEYTDITGDLSVGDEVQVIYNGDLS